MDSAKNKKLFPDFAELSPPSEASTLPFAAFANVKERKFELPSAFWDRIETDPELKAEWESRLEERARLVIEKEAEPRRQAIFDEAQKQGFEKGVQEGREKVIESSRKLETLAEDVLKEKEAILREHEAVWCQALLRLHKRFLVPLSVDRLKAIQAWLEDSIGDLSRQSKIRVQVPSSIYAQVSEAVKQDLLPHWEWMEDRTLSEKDFRVELVGGGIFFSAENEWKKFETKLDEILGASA